MITLICVKPSQYKGSQLPISTNDSSDLSYLRQWGIWMMYRWPHNIAISLQSHLPLSGTDGEWQITDCMYDRYNCGESWWVVCWCKYVLLVDFILSGVYQLWLLLNAKHRCFIHYHAFISRFVIWCYHAMETSVQLHVHRQSTML